MKDCRESLTLPLVAGILGCVTGYLIGDRSDEVIKLRSEVTAFQAQLQRPNNPWRSRRGVPDSLKVAPPAPVPASLAEKQALMHQQFNESVVAKRAAERSEEYDKLFSQLGVSPERIEHFKSLLTDLHWKAIAADEPLKELMKGRKAYDREVKGALGEENYLRYRQYEELKPATLEYNEIRAFSSSEKNTAIAPAYADQIIQLIKDTDAATTEDWENPYGPHPRSMGGPGGIVKELNAQIANVGAKSNLLIEKLRESGIPELETQVVADYYQNKVQSLRDDLRYWDRPEEIIMAEKIAEKKKEMLEAAQEAARKRQR